MQYIDIGLNLFCSQFQDPEAVYRKAWEEGVVCILTGSDMEENERIHTFTHTHEVWGTCGIHPHGADRRQEHDMQRIGELYQNNPRIVAIGECGLDYNRMFSEKEHQLECFQAHVELAETLKAPLFIHERDASEDMQHILRAHPSAAGRAVVHCFTGDRRTMEAYLDAGTMIGITGWICDDRRGMSLREAVRYLPMDRVMLETDAPYLVPRNVPGLDRINKPENIRFVLETLAEYMETDAETLRKQTFMNTIRFFSLPDRLLQE